MQGSFVERYRELAEALRREKEEREGPNFDDVDEQQPEQGTRAPAPALPAPGPAHASDEDVAGPSAPPDLARLAATHEEELRRQMAADEDYY